MLDARFTPITNWPKKPTASHMRQRGQFKAGWRDTLDLLEKELNAVKAKDIVIEGWFTSKDIRNDGWPRSDARPTQPGVILKFTGKHGPILMPCDTYTTWESNLRAIALTLKSLRDIDRHGASYDGQQYSGWKQMPESTAGTPLVKAATLLIVKAATSDKQINAQNFERIWKAAVFNTHPDRGGDGESVRAVLAARDLIKQERGW